MHGKLLRSMSPRRPPGYLLALATSLWLAAAACSTPPALDAGRSDAADAAADASDAVSDTPPAPATPQYTLADGCDPLVPSYCGYPFPSDTWLVADPTARRGRRVIFGPRTLPRTRAGVTPPDAFRFSDGFSPGGYALTHMPGATTTGLPSSTSIAASLAADSPTVVLDAATGARVAHYDELDAHSNSDAARALMIRPAARLRDAARYIVAIRNVVGADGAPLPPSDAFRALRDNLPFPADPSIEARRARYEAMFAQLAAAGVPRASLQLVWDFTTASRENNTEGMLAMRDAALAALGPDGPPYVIDSVQRDVNANVAVRIEGRITVPLYLDVPGPGGRTTLDANGMPVQNGTAQYPFLVIVPRSVAAASGPAPLLLCGHGLFGTRHVIDSELWSGAGNAFGYVMFAMDWLGMSQEDPPAIAQALLGGDVSRFVTVPDRGRQAFLNVLLATRMMAGAFGREPAVQFGGHSAIDPTRRYYLGGSQGGIYGTSVMALSTDIERGVLLVPGQSYSLMLPRSVLYDEFETLLNSLLVSRLDAPLALGLTQMLWDRAEPTGYSPYVTSNPLPGTPAHRVLVVAAVGDHEVPNVATDDLARTLGLRLLQPAVRPVFGLEPVEGTFAGSALVEEDWGLPPVPVGNLPMREGEDPHGRVFDPAPIQRMVDGFLRTGAVRNECAGACDPD